VQTRLIVGPLPVALLRLAVYVTLENLKAASAGMISLSSVFEWGPCSIPT